MSWFGKLVTTVQQAVAPKPPASVRVPVQRPTPPSVVVVAPAAAPSRPAGTIPARAGTPVVSASQRQSAKPAPPVVPWIPNDAPSLHHTLAVIRASIGAVDAATADVIAITSSVWWKGPDADRFVEQCRRQRAALNETRHELAAAARTIEHAAAEEQIRFSRQAQAL